MFFSAEEAADELEARFGAAVAHKLTSALAPALAFQEGSHVDASSAATRFGGAPALSRERAWPVRPELSAGHPIRAAGGETHAAEIAFWADRAFPLTFFAQIDLREAHAASPRAAAGLPDAGRLLFFYDQNLGPLWSGPSMSGNPGVVIFDDSPTWSARGRPTHEELLKQQAKEEADWLQSQGMEPSEDALQYLFPYEAPARRLQLQEVLSLPSQHCWERYASPTLDALLNSDEISYGYEELAEILGADYGGGPGYENLSRFLGYFAPVQWEPRLAILFDLSEFLSLPFRDAGWIKETLPRVTQWRPLLQIDLGELTRRLVEGVVYYYIHENDLAARNFERVRAVYQQT